MTMLRTQGDAGWCEALADDDVDIDRDRTLVTRAQAGDRAAFDDLYARYYRRLCRFCLKRLHDEHEAEDVAQEAFVRAWQALPGFAGERRFYPWLSVIAAHLCSNVVRKRNRSDPVAEFGDRNLASWEDVGEEHVLSAHDCALAARAFAQLSPRHQAILDMRESLGWSYQQIADHEGVRITTVESLLWRARAALKREFTAQGGEGALAAFFGSVAINIRRWFRTPEAVIQRTEGLAPSATSFVVTSAAAAATTLAAIVGSIAPNLIAPSPAAPAARPQLVASAGGPGASGSGGWSPSYGSAGVPAAIGPGTAQASRPAGAGGSPPPPSSGSSGPTGAQGGGDLPSVPAAPALPGTPSVPSDPSVPPPPPPPDTTTAGTPSTPPPPGPTVPDPGQTVNAVTGTAVATTLTVAGSLPPPPPPSTSLPGAPSAGTTPGATTTGSAGG